MNCLIYINKDFFFFRFSIKWKIKMSPISGQERTKKYRSMMLEQKKRYVSEKDSERKREERKKIKLLLKQLEKWQKDKLCQQKRREVLKQINSPDVLEESLLKERRKTEKFRKKCSLSNSRRHSANADAIADVKSNIIISHRHFFANGIYSAT